MIIYGLLYEEPRSHRKSWKCTSVEDEMKQMNKLMIRKKNENGKNNNSNDNNVMCVHVCVSESAG